MGEAAKKVTVNIPINLLNNAKKLTGASITATIIEGLREIERRSMRRALSQLKGQIDFELDLESTRK